MGYLHNEKTNCSKTSLYDRVKKLLVTDEWSDCCFSVAGKGFKAHKLILGISSPVFEAMFYGPLSTEEKILITDIQSDTFQLLLNYIYTDTVEISSIEQAFELLYASRKYLLEHLSDICIIFIKTNVSVDNVIEILNYPDYMQDKQLISFSLKLFCEHANYLFDEKKKQISLSCMKTVLESDQMNITEKDLITHVFDWSVFCCEQNKIPVTMENQRNMLQNNGLFKLLRFLSLTIDQLEEIISSSNNLLLPCEVKNIKSVINSHNELRYEVSPIGNGAIPRNLLKLQWHICYRNPLRSVAPIVIDSNNHIICSRLKSSKSIFVNSLSVPTRMAPAVYFRNNAANIYSEQLSVSICSESDNSIIRFTNFMNTVEYDSIINIELSEPCFIKKDEWYKISFIWPVNQCPTYSYGVEFRHKLFTGHKITFEFDDLPISVGNVGSFLGGLKFCL